MSDKQEYSDHPWLNPDAVPFIKVEGITKKYGSFTAVNEAELEIYQGELFSLLGSSGCGKTTFLRILAGLDMPSSGRVYIDGIDITNMPPYERPVNMMFQSYALFPHMTVEQNVAYGLKRDGIHKKEIAHRVEDILTMVELSGLSKRKPHQLSGGQRQRVALARALVKRPKVLLLDEPLAALDKRLREQTQFELMNIQNQLGITFIVVTHDQDEAMTLSTRIAVMDEGRFIQIGPPSKLYEQPDNRFIASFIGSINLFEGRIVNSDGKLFTVHVKSQDQEFMVEYNHHLDHDSRVWMAIRPEKIMISKKPPKKNKLNLIAGIVDNIAYIGNMSTYQVKLESDDIIEVSHPNQRRTEENRMVANWDDTVYLQWTSSDAVLLTH